MLELIVRPRARSDLKGIWSYTFKKWGAQQADRYLQDIDTEIRSLLKFPEIGTPCDSARLGYRALHVHRHLVFYRITPAQIEIVRVLHDAMDVQSPL